MANRLFVAVLGHRQSGKSTTWNQLFDREVRTGKLHRDLELRPSECAEVFLISGSNEERKQYAGDVLKNVDAKIILCSVQYVEEGRQTLSYAFDNNFDVYIQWLNPGHDVVAAYFDYLGLLPLLLAAGSTLTIRDGNLSPISRVQEIKEFIYGWAKFRGLIFACPK